MYRQGDVLIIRLDKTIPEEAEKVEPTERGHVLAEGEATGHAHAIMDVAEVEVLSLEEALFLKVGRAVQVVHEEHAPLTLPEGTYQVIKQREFTPQRIRPVWD